MRRRGRRGQTWRMRYRLEWQERTVLTDHAVRKKAFASRARCDQEAAFIAGLPSTIENSVHTWDVEHPLVVTKIGGTP